MSQLTTTQVDPSILQKKRDAWAKMGEAVYTGELQLQVRAQAALQNITLPAAIEQVPAAETSLKTLKAAMASISEDRKAITSKFADVTQRLMQPEKSMEEPIKALEVAIINVKKENKAAQGLAQKKLDEKRRIIEYLVGLRATVEADYKLKISTLISKAYEYALGEGSITLDGLDEYTQKVANKLTEKDFSPTFPARTIQYITQDEYAALVQNHFTFDANSYLLQFITDLEAKFSDYQVALQNKEDALALSRKEDADKEMDIQQHQAVTTASAALFSGAATVSDTMPAGVKDLKLSYEVDMPETVESVIAIFAAFSANRLLCLPKLKVNKWFAFTPAQAATALSKVKCDDNAFQPAGIIFKVVDKL